MKSNLAFLIFHHAPQMDSGLLFGQHIGLKSCQLEKKAIMAVILSWDPGTIGHCFGIARVHNIRSFLVATWREDRINIYI